MATRNRERRDRQRTVGVTAPIGGRKVHPSYGCPTCLMLYDRKLVMACGLVEVSPSRFLAAYHHAHESEEE